MGVQVRLQDGPAAQGGRQAPGAFRAVYSGGSFCFCAEVRRASTTKAANAAVAGTHPPVAQDQVRLSFRMIQKGERTPCAGSGSAQGSQPQGLLVGVGRALTSTDAKVKGRRHWGGGEGAGGTGASLGDHTR